MFHLRKSIIVCLALCLTIEALPQFSNGNIQSSGQVTQNQNSGRYSGNFGKFHNVEGRYSGNFENSQIVEKQHTGMSYGPAFVESLADHSTGKFNSGKFIGSLQAEGGNSGVLGFNN